MVLLIFETVIWVIFKKASLSAPRSICLRPKAETSSLAHITRTLRKGSRATTSIWSSSL